MGCQIGWEKGYEHMSRKKVQVKKMQCDPVKLQVNSGEDPLLDSRGHYADDAFDRIAIARRS